MRATSEQRAYSLFPIPCSLFSIPCSLFPVPYSLFPIPYSLFPFPCYLLPVPCSLFPVIAEGWMQTPPVATRKLDLVPRVPRLASAERGC